MDDSTTKQCRRCGAEKPLTEFPPAKLNRDGRHSWCRVCMRAYQNERDKSPESRAKERAEYRARMENDPEFRARKSKKTKDRYHSSPEYREKMIALQHERYAVPEIRDHILQRASERTAEGRYRERDRERSKDPQRRKQRVIHEHKRRALKLGSETSFTPAEWDALCARYNHRCLCCGPVKPLTADHVIPLSRGGSNAIDNIQPLCHHCNSRKGTKTTDYRPLWGGD